MCMDQERYDLVFSGDLVSGFELAQVKRNLQALFRIDESKVEQLFSGKSTVLKRGLDLDAATKYRTAMKKAGACLELIAAVVQAKDESSADAGMAAKPVLASKAREEETRPQWSSELGAQPLVSKVPRPMIQAPDFGIAAPGEDLLAPEEKSRVVPVKVDLKDLAVVESGGDLLSPEEKIVPPASPVQTPEFDVMPAGSDMLNSADRPELLELHLDLSGFELAPVGTRLGPPRKEAPKPPAIDHLTLQK